jgi:PAS domain S-box-containing protein
MQDPINILIVDDREENIVVMEALIKRADVKIYSTTSPNDALKTAWENQISIALVDVQMPGIDGFELVDMLKSNPRTKNILVLFVTAISTEVKYAVKGLGTGAIDYLYKPLDPYITSAKIDSFIQLARYQRDVRDKNEELQNFALIVKNSPDIISVVDARGYRIQSINPAVEKILGFKPVHFIGKSILDMVVEEDKTEFRKKLGQIIKDNTEFTVFEVRFNTFEQTTIWVECRISYQNALLFFNISDISHTKSYQEQLIKLKDAAEHGKKVKENFLANMSHELRTPIGGIIGLTDMLKKTQVTDQQSNMLELLDTSSQSLLGVINDVLDISKIEAGKFSIVQSPGNLIELLNSVFNLLKFKADKKSIDLILEVADDIPEYIMVDSLRLNQILMNLLSNAINFTERGHVKLKVQVLKRSGDAVKLKFSIEDTGIGIPANKIKSIFDSFEQAEKNTSKTYGGTGLGLAIVKKLVELKGGELNVSSKIGKGSIFSFVNWHTVVSKPQDGSADALVAEMKPFQNISMLVAEDNLVNQFMLAKLLKDWNVEFDMVDNGRKALEKLREKNYDLVLMDTHMPEMNGYIAARAIRMGFEEPKRSVPILSLSASALEKEHNEALAAGMNDALSKPFKPLQLYEKIARLTKQY